MRHDIIGRKRDIISPRSGKIHHGDKDLCLGSFFEFHDLLFDNQQTWSSSNAPNAIFIQYAEQLELDIPTFKRQMSSSALRDKVRAEFDEGRGLNITGTPTFFLNGEKMEFETYQSFVEQIAFAIDPESASTTDTADTGVRFGI